VEGFNRGLIWGVNKAFFCSNWGKPQKLSQNSQYLGLGPPKYESWMLLSMAFGLCSMNRMIILRINIAVLSYVLVTQMALHISWNRIVNLGPRSVVKINCILNSSVFWDIMLCSPFKVKPFRGTCCLIFRAEELCLLPTSCWFLVWLILRPWKWRQHVPLKQRHCHLWTDCLENVGASMSLNPMDLHGLLQGNCYLFFFTSFY
jgi:hypothetical protein